MLITEALAALHENLEPELLRLERTLNIIKSNHNYTTLTLTTLQ